MSGSVVWFTGLPGAGKTTLAFRVQGALRQRGHQVLVLDSDELREALVPSPDYGPEGRDAFYSTLANLAVVFAEQNMVVLVAATAHRRAFRERARSGTHPFVEVYVDTPREVCEQRDFKGLYKTKPEALPGVGVAYEPPEIADVTAHGGHDDQAIAHILERICGQDRG